MRPWALLPICLVCVFALSAPSARGQETPSNEQIRSVLASASALLPQVSQQQQSSFASNLAGEQLRAGDLNGALASIASLPNANDRLMATGNIASMLSWRGNLAAGLDLVRRSAAGDASSLVIVQGHAQNYSSIAGALALKKDFAKALQIAQLIQNGPAFFGRTNLFVQTLLRIRSKQWEAGDEGAQKTLDMALQAVEAETDHPFEPTFSESMPAGMYGEIARQLFQEGNRELASQILQRVYGLIAAAGDTKHRQDTIFQLAYSQAGMGDLQAAENTVQQLDAGQQRDGVEMLIAQKKMKEGDPLAELDRVLAIGYEGFKDISIGEIATALSDEGNYVQALSTLDKISALGDRAWALARLALHQADKGDPQAGLSTQLALEMATAAGKQVKPFTFAQIAVTKEDLGDYSDALELLDKLGVDEKIWVLRNLTVIWIGSGRETDALALADSEPPAIRAHLLLQIGSEWIANERKRTKASQGGQ